jgi:mRNA interferase MazF
MINQYDVYWVTLDPTMGSEIKKTRPCVIISPDELNRPLSTVLVAPLTSAFKSYPFRVNCTVQGKAGSIAIDQIRCIDKSRLTSKISQLPDNISKELKKIIYEMLVK